jgi:predicted AAA+ superfamily ATPase
MQQIPTEQVLLRIEAENIWWQPPHAINKLYDDMRHRAYFRLLYPLVNQIDVNRAILLMGPRRVGKTVLLHHVVKQLIADGVDPRRICYLSADHPIYNNCSLHDLLRHYQEASRITINGGQAFVIFDEIQYVRDWEIQLKTLVDSYPGVRFVASGSAAAALKIKSNESGAGRFTDFLLPPLTFHEYLDLLHLMHLIGPRDPNGSLSFASSPDIVGLNDAFVRYLNFGGYPEVIFSPTIQADPARFIKSDIIDKVLLRDLPSLYGIQDIRELNYLFTSLAFNTAGEVSLEQLSQNAGVAKNTIKRYIEYLEAAFLIKVVHRIDRSAKRFTRASCFKVYLTNPSIRSALFAPMGADEAEMGHLAETGIFSQWFHTTSAALHYARWGNGEVDIVSLNAKLKPVWAVEVKWSDRHVDNHSELRSLISFCKANEVMVASVTTRSRFLKRDIGGVTVTFVPASIYCFTVGYNLVRNQVEKIAALGPTPVAPELPSNA